MPILHYDTIAVTEAEAMKILLAEDDINLGKLLSMLLKKQNITVNWVQDGEAAYDAVYADGYDVLVLDWMMPLLSGLDLCKRLREEDYQGKILLLTAKDTLADKVEGLNSGADDYLVNRGAGGTSERSVPPPGTVQCGKAALRRLYVGKLYLLPGIRRASCRAASA